MKIPVLKKSSGAEVPRDYVVVVEIVNYMDMKLTDYQLYIPYGLEHQKAPTSISFKTREVFTFNTNGSNGVFHGDFLYRVGDTGFSLHLLCWWTNFGIGFLENNAAVQSLLPIKNGCNKYTHIGTPESMKCIENYPYRQDDTRNMIIHQGNLYAKLTIKSKQERLRLILTLELFNCNI
ncbi:unnamed protein product [Allacma fusca]|uniref:Uncharacterized protein n=1 Tax=Allacma fusca TaxID=39272 RepID=A0A8J2MBL2_9HEXA|nr:unnamed protein product [Allacma fusca]